MPIWYKMFIRSWRARAQSLTVTNDVTYDGVTDAIWRRIWRLRHVWSTIQSANDGSFNDGRIHAISTQHGLNVINARRLWLLRHANDDASILSAGISRESYLPATRLWCWRKGHHKNYRVGHPPIRLISGSQLAYIKGLRDDELRRSQWRSNDPNQPSIGR